MIAMKMEGAVKVMQNLERVSREIQQQKKVTMAKAGVYIMNYIQRNKLSGQVLKRRTGRLAGSFKYKVEEYGRYVSVRVGSNLIYSAIHERHSKEERTIRAKNGRYLTIPISKQYGGGAVTTTGVVRKPARQWEDTFVAMSKKGNLIIFQNKGNNKIVPLFVLKEEVTLPYRPYVRPSLNETKDRVVAMTGEMVSMAIRRN